MTPLTTLLDQLRTRADLTQAEAAELLAQMLSDDTTEEQIAEALTLLAAKGETEAELAGFAETMRRHSSRITSARHTGFLDTCGTGGSQAKTFNVSTAAAFVVAAAGVPVAKHGNVGITSKSGSADVLRALGVRVDLTPERVCECFDEVGVCFMFAPLHHPATKRVAQVRRRLGTRTIFNLLGPLTNPAGAPWQLIGVSDLTAGEKLAGALVRLGTQRAWVVHGLDGLDEITLADQTVVYEVDLEGVKDFEISPEDFGLSYAELDGLRGGSAEENADIIRGVLSGDRRDEARDLILLNAAAAICVAGACVTPGGAVEMAASVIDSGEAMAKLEAFRDFSQR
ncbi:MAG TPA: anthranilate phosphoribosyltransferase [Blastocatellia bacterium]|nr:anthranilate phosphoribosyltransferase [Blastocatellia bacterium]